MKRMKKVLAVMLVLAMSIMGIPSFAVEAKESADGVEFAVDSATAKPGEEVTVAVRVGENAKCSALEFVLSYDNTKLELVTENDKTSTKGTEYRAWWNDLSDQVAKAGPAVALDYLGQGNAIKFSAAVNAEMNQAGRILLVTFKVKEGATGEAALTLSDILLTGSEGQEIDETTGQVISQGDEVDYRIVNGKITIDAAEEPTTETPSTEEPTTEEASTEEPTTEEASTEEPTTEEASTEEPSTETSNVDIMVNNASATVGDNVTVQVNLGKNAKASALQFELAYDSTKLEYVSYSLGKEYKELLDANESAYAAYAGVKGSFKFAAATYAEMTDAFTAVTITFKTLQIGNSTVSLKDVILKDKEEKDVEFTAKNGTVAVSDKSSGGNITILPPTTDTSIVDQVIVDDTITYVKETAKINVTIPQGYTASSITYASGDEKVATVATDGTVTGVGMGTATITTTITINGASRTITSKVTVKEYAINRVTVSKAVTAYVGQTSNIEMTVPQGKVSKVTYASADKKIAKVTKKGVVTGVKEGKTTITATVTAYGKTKTFTTTVTVKEYAINKVSVPSTLSVKVGNSKKITLTVPQGKVSKVTYKSSDKKIATVGKKGKVTGKKAGTAKITVTVTAYGKTKTFTTTVTVKK